MLLMLREEIFSYMTFKVARVIFRMLRHNSEYNILYKIKLTTNINYVGKSFKIKRSDKYYELVVSS